MDLRNCADCGRPFIYAGVELCPSCVEEEETSFDKLRDYLRDNPGADVDTVAGATGIPRERMLRFLRKGRLETGELGDMQLGCVSCGAPIKSGRYCDRCSASLLNTLRSAEGGKNDQPEAKPADKPPAGGQSGRGFYVSRYLKKRDDRV